jgi:hypothetical protein
VEDAKKLLVDKPIEVQGLVKVDQSGELKNLYELARRAKNDNNSENAHKYYDQILVKDPSSWEANFYTVYYQSMNCKIGEIQSAAIRLSNCEDTVLQIVKDNVTEPEERKRAVDEIAGRLINISTMLYGAAKNHYSGIASEIRDNYTQQMINNCCAARDIVYNIGNYIIQFFGDEYGKDIAVPCWKTGITQHNGLMSNFAQKDTNKNIIMDYVGKIQKYDSSYQAPTIITSTSSSGCYVATAIYGSYDCPQVWTLRRYRDYTLAETLFGRAFIRTYYTISPTLVKWFGETVWFKKMWRGQLDSLVAKLQARGVEDTEYEDRFWK